MSVKDKSAAKKKFKKHSHNKNKSGTESDYKSSLSDLDLHLLGEGNHFKSYEKLGAKLKTVKKKTGVEFIVWAPNAKSVSVTGEFSGWSKDGIQMQKINHSGYWGIFIPGLEKGTVYKYSVKSKSGDLVFKSDPYAFRAEMRPGNASIVDSPDNYEWNDKKWMKERKKLSTVNNSFKKKPISIYEVHLGSWKKDYDNI